MAASVQAAAAWRELKDRVFLLGVQPWQMKIQLEDLAALTWLRMASPLPVRAGQPNWTRTRGAILIAPCDCGDTAVAAKYSGAGEYLVARLLSWSVAVFVLPQWLIELRRS